MTLERIAGRDGAVCGLALDHRDSLRAVARRRGYPDDDDALSALKVELARGLAREASVVLLDVELGTAAMRELGTTPLAVSLEAQGYETIGEGRRTTLLADLDPARAAALGARGCKVLLPYRPDLAAAAHAQEELVARVVASCRAAGVLSIIEPIVYGEVAEFADAVVATAQRIAHLGPDLLKLQYPGDAAACRRVTRACGRVAWVLLGGGSDERTFLDQLRSAVRAGARGFIVGRTAWDAALVSDPLEQERAIVARAAFLARAHEIAAAPSGRASR